MGPPLHRPPLFVYLVKAKECSRDKSRIGVATNPFTRVREHCRRSRWWKWDIVLIVGPFLEGANLFKNQWQTQSRKFRCRVIYGVQKALSYRPRTINIYAKEPSEIIQVFKNRKRKSRI